MRTMRVTFDVDVPDEATSKEVEDWIAFELHQVCSLQKSPLSFMDIEATDIISIYEV